MEKKNDNEDQSGFLEAPVVRMLRMRSASLKIKELDNFWWSRISVLECKQVLKSLNTLCLICLFFLICRYFKTQDKPVQMSSTWNGLKLRNATLTLKTMPETPGLHFGLDLPVFPVFPRLLQSRPWCGPQLRRTIVTRCLTQYPRAFASKFFQFWNSHQI